MAQITTYNFVDIMGKHLELVIKDKAKKEIKARMMADAEKIIDELIDGELEKITVGNIRHITEAIEGLEKLDIKIHILEGKE